jgi:hypothetical protein
MTTTTRERFEEAARLHGWTVSYSPAVNAMEMTRPRPKSSDPDYIQVTFNADDGLPAYGSAKLGNGARHLALPDITAAVLAALASAPGNPEVSYPNAQHGVASEAIRRELLHALDDIGGLVTVLRRKAGRPGTVLGADDGRELAARAALVSVRVAQLAMLADVRDWDAANAPEDAPDSNEYTGHHS